MKFQFESLTDLFGMSGHGPYVWAAYGITFSAILLLLLAFWLARKNFFKQQLSIAKRASQNTEQGSSLSASSTTSSGSNAAETSV